MKVGTMIFLVLSGIAASASGQLAENTVLRMASMPKAPVIDGKIDRDEWKYASTTFGGISPKSGLMTSRRNDFRFGYDAENIYFSITSEMPFAPQQLNSDDRVELQLIPPGKTAPVTIEFDSTGKGKFPAGTRIANGFGISLMTSEQGKCWTAEAAIPLSAFGVDSIRNGQEWKLQMARHWSSQQETGYFHNPKRGGKMAAFIPDEKAPIVSFDGFGHHMYPATGNYNWTYRIESTQKNVISVYSNSFRSGLSGAPTLDINNPDLFGKEQKKPIGSSTRVIPGKSSFFELYMMAQFPGKPRCLFSRILGNDRKTVLYQRLMFWDVRLAQLAAVYKDSKGLPYLNAGYYPSYGEKLRVAASFNKKLPIAHVKISVKNSAGKILHTFAKSGFGRPLGDFEDQVVLKNLPPDHYAVAMESTDMDGRKYVHERTFSIAKFSWQGLNLGKERIIIPPFKPLRVNRKKQEVHALLTGYRIGGGIWEAVYSEGENLLAAPVRFVLDGKPLPAGETRLVSAEKDRVIYETTVKNGKLKFVLNQEYDYDGFCKLTTRIIPDGPVKVRSFELRIPMKDEYVKYYAALRWNRARAQGKDDVSIPDGQGVLELKGLRKTKGRIQNYLWFGTAYKGFSWIIDTQKGFSLNEKSIPYRLERRGKTVTFIQDIVNRPAFWNEPWEFTFGFSPTPVKPANKNFRRISEPMYDYPPAKGSVNAGFMGVSQWPLSYFYPIHMFPEGDDSLFRVHLDSRGKAVTAAQRKQTADAYLARHKEWLMKNAPLADPSRFRNSMYDRRPYGNDYFLIYHNPAFYSCRWAEAEMYKAEWLPWDYPVDDAHNEYVACQTPQYIDKMLWEMQTQIDYGFDGMNFDCFPLGGGFNTVSMGAFRKAPGPVPFILNSNMLQTAPYGIVSCSNLFGWRELMKRTAHLLYSKGRTVFGVPWVDLHTTSGAVPSVTAFCSTVITTECASNGSHYFDRFPASYVMSDLAGMQAGIIPRIIVSTHSSKLPVKEQVHSLIAFSFAYGLMNHVDQGVTRNQKDYGKVRDEVFTFGYGRPENRTIAFYDKEKQPISCNAKEVLTTQVIRPDGKALLMAGNTGDHKVKVRFDLSGLNYGKYKITDLLTGKAVFDPEIELTRNGYALWKIEKQGGNGK